MMKQRLSRFALEGAAVAAALALAACGAQPAPQPVEQPPPPPPPPTGLLGGPEAPPPEPLPPPVEAPPPAAEAPPPAPVVIAMAPIPNPPERPRAEPAAPRPAKARPQPAPARRRAEAAPAPRAAARPTAQAPAPRPALKVAPPPAKPVPPPQPKPAPKAAPPKLAPAPALKAPAAPTAPAAGAPAPASPLGERAARLAALESELADATRKAGVLTAPDRLTVNQPAEVTLVLPASFAQTVREAAARNRLGDAAAAVNLTALLAGEGYVITPSAAQSQPLAPGQPTEFRWTVNAMPGERGRLHADVGADLLGVGAESLTIGSVEAARTGGLSPRLLGAGVLVLLALLVIAFLARNPQGRSRPAEVRRRQPLNLREKPR